MTLAELSHSRLRNQQIVASTLRTPQAVVAYMGAMQAQDYPMAKWAVGTRLAGATDQHIEAALDAGEIVRTHVLRPTWHFVAAADARWMLALSAPRIRSAMAAYERQLGLDATTLTKSIHVVARALEGGRHLTREELMQAVETAGIPTNSSRAAHVMMHAELDGIVCNGAMRGKQFTYALMDEKVPKGPVLAREEALAALARRYFESHGPATLADFHWWSGLPMPDARAGVAMAKPHLMSEKVEGCEYWSRPDAPIGLNAVPGVHFLPAFDEFMVSYKDRSAALAAHLQQEAITGNGIFKPIVVVDGRVVGIWKRSVKKDAVVVEVQFFDPKTTLSRAQIQSATQGFADFLGLGLKVA
jgi:hypothetical protein